MYGTNKQSFDKTEDLKKLAIPSLRLLCTLEDEVLKTPTRDLPEDVCSKTKFHSAVELQNVWHHHSYIVCFTSYLKIFDNILFSP